MINIESYIKSITHVPNTERFIRTRVAGLNHRAIILTGSRFVRNYRI